MIDAIRDHELSLDELSAEVESLLEKRNLAFAQPDHRVSAKPDARTIRYYSSLGLLDRPTIQGRQAIYGRRHLLQLLAIKTLQLTSLPLAEIQARLYGLSDTEIEAVINSVSAASLKTLNRVQGLVKPTYWKEIVIEPGLKLLAAEEWSLAADPASIAEKIQAAIVALQISSRKGNGGKIDDDTSV
jgi:DNA-binding transcriptional MerR regulator